MATLKTLVDETTNIKNELIICYSVLKNMLIRKEVAIEEDSKLIDLIDKVNPLSNGFKVVAGEDFDFYYSATEVRTSTSPETVTKWTMGGNYTHSPTDTNLDNANVLLSFYGSQDNASWPSQFKIEVIRGEEIVNEKIFYPTTTGYVKYSCEFEIKRNDIVRMYVRQEKEGGIGYIKNCRVSYSLVELV